MYGYALFDPRPIDVAKAANDRIFGFGVPVYGIEVTVPALAARCIENLDPQHSGGDAETAAIEVALTEELPPSGAILATVRADLDSVGAMAVFAVREQGINLPAKAKSRVATVAAADTFARGAWPGTRTLPTTENSWPGGGSAESTCELAAMAALVSDFKVPLDERVGAMMIWLLTGEESEEYRDRVEKERHDLIAALEAGEIKTQVFPGGMIASVETTHRAATMIGYHLAPIVVALNPAFSLRGGEPHRKFTVCQYTAGYADLKAAAAEMSSTWEDGWGGSPTIVGSPQGVGSTLTIDDVVRMVEKHFQV